MLISKIVRCNPVTTKFRVIRDKKRQTSNNLERKKNGTRSK